MLPTVGGVDYRGHDAKGGEWTGQSYDVGTGTFFDADGQNGRKLHCESYAMSNTRFTGCDP
jgi:hypothetical protein